MLATLLSIPTLLLGIGILLIGSGFLGTLLGIRAGLEGFSASLTGFVMAAFFAGYIIGTYVCPPLIRRVGHIRAFAAMASVASVLVILHALWVSPWVWLALRIITGICLVGLYMIIESWLNAQASSERRGKVFAAYMTINLLALGVSQFLIMIYGAAGVAPFALAAIFLSLGLVPIALTRVAEPGIDSPAPLGLRHLYRVSPLGMAGTFIAGVGNGAFWALGAVFAHGIGLSDTGIAGFMSAVVLGGALLQSFIGHQSDRHDRRKVLIVVSFLGASAGMLMFFTAGHSQAGLLISALLYGGFAFSVYPLSVAHTNDHLSPAEVLEATRSLLLLNGIGATLGPLLAGPLLDVFGMSSLMAYFAALLGLFGLFGLYRMQVSAPVPGEEQVAFVPMARTSQVALEMDPRTETETELNTPPR